MSVLTQPVIDSPNNWRSKVTKTTVVHRLYRDINSLSIVKTTRKDFPGLSPLSNELQRVRFVQCNFLKRDKKVQKLTFLETPLPRSTYLFRV